jgi:integrase
MRRRYLGAGPGGADGAGLGPPAEHALISLLALNGLRVSEATNADVEALGIERGVRTHPGRERRHVAKRRLRAAPLR